MGPSRPSPRRFLVAGVAVVAAGAVAAAVVPAAVIRTAPAGAAAPAVRPVRSAPAVAAPVAAPRPSNIDRLLAQARRRYSEEVNGAAVHVELRRVASDPGVRRALQSGNVAALRTYVQSRFNAVWYHQHVSRLRILRGGRVVTDIGVPFVVSPATRTIRGTGGKSLGTLEVSIQDVIGYVKYMHRNFPVDVVVRGQGAGHVRTSLPAAAAASLPTRGPVTFAGRHYLVRSFSAPGMGGERLTVWILTKA